MPTLPDDPFDEVEFTDDWVADARAREESADARANRYARIVARNARIEQEAVAAGKPMSDRRYGKRYRARSVWITVACVTAIAALAVLLVV